MCGRFSLTAIAKVLTDHYAMTLGTPMKFDFKYWPRYNIAPTQHIPIVMNTNKDVITQAHWGLIPHWAKAKNMGYRMINARAETLLEKTAYKGCFRYKRCLIPADGFYEWKKHGNQKHPFRFTIDQPLFSFAGLYDMWEKEGEVVLSCTIITVPPNEWVKNVHDRMPAILRSDQEKIWLEEENTTALSKLLAPYDNPMKSVAISSRINNAAHDAPDVLTPVKQLSISKYT